MSFPAIISKEKKLSYFSLFVALLVTNLSYTPETDSIDSSGEVMTNGVRDSRVPRSLIYEKKNV